MSEEDLSDYEYIAQTDEDGNINIQIKAPQPSRGSAWSTIVFMMIFFFPIGICLMMYKLHVDVENYQSNARKTAVFGWLIAVPNIYIVFSEITSETGYLSLNEALIFIPFLCFGLALILIARKYKRLGKKYSRYLAVLRNSPNGNIENIASLMKCTYEEACKDLQKMIDKDLLPDTYIDEIRGIIIGPMIRKPSVDYSSLLDDYNNLVGALANNAKQKEPKAAKCPHCGAITSKENNNGSCEYCGSPFEFMYEE